MKTNKASSSVLGVLVLAVLLIIGILKIQQVHAQVAATSSTDATSSQAPTIDESANTAPPSPEVLGASTSTDTPVPTSSTAQDDTAASTSSAEPSSPAAAAPTVEAPPAGLTEVHIIGTKYVDYFTDGTTVTAYPGDPKIDSNFDKPDAPIPTHQGLTWVHSTGGYLYDTPSGELEVGDYAAQPDGSYITNAPPFISSTSTPAMLGGSTSASVTPSDNSSTSIKATDPADTIASTTISTGSTTTSSNQ